MKIPNLIVSAVVLACIYLTSCVNGDPAQDLDYSSDRKNEYTKNWVKTFGLIDASQDWCMVTAVNATVFYDTFSGCTALQTLNLDGWNFASGADLRYFLENTSNLTVKCSAEAEATLRAVTQLGSSSITFTRP